MCPIHIRVEWELQDLGNNVPATNKELESVSYGENSSCSDGKGKISLKEGKFSTINYLLLPLCTGLEQTSI